MSISAFLYSDKTPSTDNPECFQTDTVMLPSLWSATQISCCLGISINVDNRRHISVPRGAVKRFPDWSNILKQSVAST